jgi:rhamnosyl/mannosyltransferase
VRVLHVYKTYWTESYGGIEQAIRQIALATTKFGDARNSVLTLGRCKKPELTSGEGIALYRFPLDLELASTGMSRAALWNFRRLASEHDVVHYHFPWPFADLMHFLAKPRARTVLTYHSDIVRQRVLLQLYRPLLGAFLRSVDRVVTTSPNYLATSNVLKNLPRPVDVVPLGLDENTYHRPEPDKLEYWRSRFGSNFFLFVGHLRYYKGLHILLDACQGTPFTVAVVGAGPIQSELQQHAQRLQLSDVHFLGAVDDEDKMALLHACRAVVFPSMLRSEAFGLSLLEGAMAGKPLISSEIGTGTSYINIDGDTGIVVPPSDPAALRQAMQRLLHGPEAESMGQRARERYRKLFAAEHMAERYLGIYRELLMDSRGTRSNYPASARRSART